MEVSVVYFFTRTQLCVHGFELQLPIFGMTLGILKTQLFTVIFVKSRRVIMILSYPL